MDQENKTSYYDLLLRSSRNITVKEEKLLIEKAFNEAYELLQNSFDEDGISNLEHSVNVARIVAEEIDLDSTSVISSLLQGVGKLNQKSLKTYVPVFGKKVVEIIENLELLSSLRMDKVSINSENFIQLLLTLSSDIRVILIRLADRLYFMRQIGLLPANRQLQISVETSGLYVPLAHRLGLYNIKKELEELAMKHTLPEVYDSLAHKIEESREEQNRYFNQFISPIKKELSANGFSFQIKYRTKSIPSIWNKMKKQNIDFEQVYDFFAIRIIIKSTLPNEKSDCWRAYSLVTNIYQPNPARLRDWISAPKSNGYESLHTTVIGPKDRWIEVQIRSQRMDEMAEKGRAAHWKYKDSKAEASIEAENWLKNIRSILENYTPSDEEIETSAKMELFSDFVYAFTPQGDLKKLKSGATVLDFAFEVHTEIGQKCSGAKVNNQYVPLKHVLKTGDLVEITTSKNQKPNKDWLLYVTTSKAITKIKRCLKDVEFSQAERGKEMLQRKLNQLKLHFSDEIANKLVSAYKAVSALDLFHGIAEDKYDLSKVRSYLLTPQKPEEAKLPDKPFTRVAELSSLKELQKSMVIVNENTPLKDVNLARCCHPVFGDDIFGFVTVAEGIKIHRQNCPNASEMYSRYPYRTLTARWTDQSEVSAFVASIVITGEDQLGMLNRISEIITIQSNASIRAVNLKSFGGKFEGSISVNVNGRSHLDLIIARLSKLRGVKKVSREM